MTGQTIIGDPSANRGLLDGLLGIFGGSGSGANSNIQQQQQLQYVPPFFPGVPPQQPGMLAAASFNQQQAGLLQQQAGLNGFPPMGPFPYGSPFLNQPTGMAPFLSSSFGTPMPGSFGVQSPGMMPLGQVPAAYLGQNFVSQQFGNIPQNPYGGSFGRPPFFRSSNLPGMFDQDVD